MGVSDYKKRVKTLSKQLESDGWTVTATNGGHLRFVPPDKSLPIVHAAATSSDPRALANLEADLRRSGMTA